MSSSDFIRGIENARHTNEFFRFIDHSVSKQYKSSPMRYKKVYTPCEEKGDDSLRKVIFAVLQIQQCI
jgi:hypothetical protein